MLAKDRLFETFPFLGYEKLKKLIVRFLEHPRHALNQHTRHTLDVLEIFEKLLRYRGNTLETINIEFGIQQDEEPPRAFVNYFTEYPGLEAIYRFVQHNLSTSPYWNYTFAARIPTINFMVNVEALVHQVRAGTNLECLRQLCPFIQKFKLNIMDNIITMLHLPI